MCGITGIVRYDGGSARPEIVACQTEILRHRGPDGQGLWCEGGAALGHRRLSLLDPGPTGAQPLANEDRSCWLTFNGELYGWREIRRSLIDRGHRLRGTSDAELILHLYEDHGDAMMSRIRGEFAFALFDARRRRLLLARDRVGVKPLYYHDDGARVIFASELKALLLDPSVPREVDEHALLDYLSFRYVPAPRTIWKGVKKLLPGHLLVLERGGVRLERYWELPGEPDDRLTDAEAGERLSDLLDEAVRLRLDAHVPVGALLSGGLDSSAVVALMARAVPGRIQTFSVGFDEPRFNELEDARRVAARVGSEHHEMVVEPLALDALPGLIWGLDEPFADVSILPTYFVSKLARTQVKAVLSGDGGDETFAGYRTYDAALRHARLGQVPSALRRAIGAASGWLHADHPLARKLRRIPLSVADRHLEAMANFTPRELSPLLSPALREELRRADPFGASRRRHADAARGLGDVPALLHLDATTYMADDVLKKVECASMMNSLEVRVPLLDHVLVEFVARLPFRFKRRAGVSKWLLRRSMRTLLPRETLARPKHGFTVPLGRWFAGGLGGLARETLLDPRATGRGWFDRAEIERRLGPAASPPDANPHQLWSLVCLELWARCYLDRARADIAAAS